TQFTYFQQCGGIDLDPITVELTYGLERIATYLQGKQSVYELQWSDDVTYGEVHQKNEWEQSTYNFELADTDVLFRHFNEHEAEAQRLLARTVSVDGKATPEPLVMPAYDRVLKCSHTFNMLDARSAISVTERVKYIGRVRKLAGGVAQAFAAQRAKMGYPLCRGEVRA
ncbi:MAG TPA: glycine--tRNA ligase subunit alpha, partial [bacterium]|nr:glycine--tRNA ligase subunit alpha [bacterium]